MTSKSYPTRTTLWDDQDPADGAAPQPIPNRTAWRAPSAVLSGERASRRVVNTMPPVADLDDGGPIPRRSRFASARTPWWRPRSTFGRILLGTGTLLVLGALITTGVITRHFLMHNAHFRIQSTASIESSGLGEVNRSDVLPVFGEDIGRNVFFVPLAERRKELETIPWVRQATVMRFLPNRLSVSVVERTPVAFVREGSRVQLADADGVILDMPPAMMARHHYSFPVLTGINAHDSLAARSARMALYLKFISELDEGGQHQSAQISEIDLSDPEDLRATMPEQGADILAHFGQDHFAQRLAVYKSHIAGWRQQYPRLTGVDLRYDNEIPLEMAPANPAEQAQAAASQTNPTGNSPTATKPATKKAAPVSHKAEEAKRRAARLRAERAKAAKARAAHAHTATVNQGQ
ncbi:cell division protein FtsQ/DivIB [Acidicapsa dinghuensis]|uniref:Cell division protein FtsQ n=1 Tax=Acidicapsa dinghuensis TaxID=2218256 RepID=A0ABW1EIE9_9BACT|nr:FtsQ-type POTRA domain-containing protein [Acidicapsa dinghuensis]